MKVRDLDQIQGKWAVHPSNGLSRFKDLQTGMLRSSVNGISASGPKVSIGFSVLVFVVEVGNGLEFAFEILAQESGLVLRIGFKSLRIWSDGSVTWPTFGSAQWPFSQALVWRNFDLQSYFGDADLLPRY